MTLSDFIKEELDDYTKKLILNLIDSREDSKKEKEVLIFNRYSLEVLFDKNEVLIYDDIFPENKALKMCINDFKTKIK